MANKMLPGETRAGVLVDGVADTPYQMCVLTYESGSGPLVEVPFVFGDDQFSVVQSWFRHDKLPDTVVFQDHRGPVTLSGVRFRGLQMGNISLGRFDARVAIFGQPREHLDEYRVSTVRSEIDGLQEFTRFKSITTEFERVEGRWLTHAVVHATDEVVARHGQVTYGIRAVTYPLPGVDFSARSTTVIETVVDDGAEVGEHLAAQWSIRALVTIAHGVPLFWRRHQLRDEAFPMWMLSGDARKPEFVEVLSQRTAHDYDQDAPKAASLGLPIFQLSDLGVGGLDRWLSLYSDSMFRRAVEPAVEVINDSFGRFVEPRFTLTMLALEALGYYLNPNRGDRDSLACKIERCLTVPGVDWSPIGEVGDIAQALAAVSNDLKHPDRGRNPDTVELVLSADLGIVALRLHFAYLAGVVTEVIGERSRSLPLSDAFQAFGRNGLEVRDGHFFRGPGCSS